MTDLAIRIVIPAHNEEMTISTVVSFASDYGSVLVIDDASTDKTAHIASSLGALVKSLPNNVGYQAAIEIGFVESLNMGFDYVVTLDADGQLDANCLSSFMRRLEASQPDLIIAQRDQVLRVSERLFNAYTFWRFGVADILCGLKGYKLVSLKQIHHFSDKNSVGTGLATFLLRKGVYVETVDIIVNDRMFGCSRFGGDFRANTKIFLAFLLCVWRDVSNHSFGERD